MRTMSIPSKIGHYGSNNRISDPVDLIQIPEKVTIKAFNEKVLFRDSFAFGDELSLPVSVSEISDLKMILFFQDLLSNFDLKLIVPKFIGSDKIVDFDSSLLGYDKDEVKKFKKLVLKRLARLPSSNFIKIDSSASEPIYGTYNLRAILYFREINFSKDQIDYILTLGISILCNFITKSEALVSIYNMISGTFEVSIRVKSRTYVIISIEPPLFRNIEL